MQREETTTFCVRGEKKLLSQAVPHFSPDCTVTPNILSILQRVAREEILRDWFEAAHTHALFFFLVVGGSKRKRKTRNQEA